jgi:hypothetical protein
MDNCTSTKCQKVYPTRFKPMSLFPGMVTIGVGAIKKKLQPAQRKLVSDGILDTIVNIDTKDQNGNGCADWKGPSTFYVQANRDSTIPLNALKQLGLTEQPILIYVSTTTKWHLHYARNALQLGDHIRVAVEKPLTTISTEAETILSGDYPNLFPVDHQLFKAEVRKAIQDIKPGEFLTAEGIEFDFLETDTIGYRDIDNAIYDLCSHGFTIILALLEICDWDGQFVINAVETATYNIDDTFQPPRVFTAARIEGYLEFEDNRVPVVFRVGKGMSYSFKTLIIWGKRNRINRVIPLDESDWRPHYSLLIELLTNQEPRLGVDLSAAVKSVKACSDACRIAKDKGSYALGSITSVSIHFSNRGTRLLKLWKSP